MKCLARGGAPPVSFAVGCRKNRHRNCQIWFPPATMLDIKLHATVSEGRSFLLRILFVILVGIVSCIFFDDDEL